MEQRDVPYRKTLFVCTNARADGRISCAGSGRAGERICAALKDAVKEAGLKGTVRVARSGCLDLCEKGPNLFVYPEGEWRSGVREEDIPELVNSLVG